MISTFNFIKFYMVYDFDHIQFYRTLKVVGSLYFCNDVQLVQTKNAVQTFFFNKEHIHKKIIDSKKVRYKKMM